MPLMIHPEEPFEEGVYVWDAWPIRNPDGTVAEIDGWVVKVGLSAEWDEVDETGWEFFTLSTWRYWYTRDGEWRPGGIIFEREEALGSRQWAGSTFYDPETQEVTFYYTAVGRPDAPSIDDDMPDRAISIHNEAAGRPLTEQRLAMVTASVSASDDGHRLRRFRRARDHRRGGRAALRHDRDLSRLGSGLRLPRPGIHGRSPYRARTHPVHRERGRRGRAL
jgi:levansucrase